MKKIIYNLRSQPVEVRKHILHVTTLCLAIILFFVWVYTLGTGLTSEETQVQIKNEAAPITTLRDNLVDGYYSIQDDTQ